mgnify:CR=1 FL=1
MMKEQPEKAKKLVDDIIRNTYQTLLLEGKKDVLYFVRKSIGRVFEK